MNTKMTTLGPSSRRVVLGGGVAVSYGLFAKSVLDRAKEAENASLFTEKATLAFASAVPQDSLRVLEIGFGQKGRNLERLPPKTKLAGIDLDPPSGSDLDRVQAQAADFGIDLSLLRGDASAIPFPDSSFDAVVGTFVLCSVTDQMAVLREISRVLKPRGRYGFVEHVRADPGTSLLKQQQIFDPLQQRLAHNCHLCRETDELIASVACGRQCPTGGDQALFSTLDKLERFQVPEMWPISQQSWGVVTR